MGVNIHIPADEVWSFFQKNKDRCTKEMVAIAENEETEYAAYLTEENGYPLFCVCKGDDDPEYEEGAISEKDCTETAKRCFLKYLFPVVVKDGKTTFKWEEDEEEDDAWSERQNMEDISYEREDELRLAMADFLQVALQEGSDGADLMDFYGHEIIDEILDHVLEYLATDHCLEIYRPMIITDELTGEEVFVEYPYNPEATYETIEEDSTMDYSGGWE